MLMPKKTRYRKVQRGNMRGRSKGGRTLAYGDFGLQAQDPHWVTSQQIESMRVSLSRRLKKIGKYYLRLFPDKPVTKKPAETRMGKGKGNPEKWVAVVKRDRVVCEIAGVNEKNAREILKGVAYKLPMKTRFISRSEVA